MFALVRRHVLAACFIGAPTLGLHAQVRQPPGVIAGTVTAARSNDPLLGVMVQVEGTRLGAVTGATGTYRIPNVPRGAHTVSARRLGYGRATQQVTVRDTGTVTADFTRLLKAALAGGL